MAAEEGLYIGSETLTARRAQAERLARSMAASPCGWLSSVLGVVLGREMRGVDEQHPAVAAFARAVLLHHGFSPDTHTLSRKRGGAFPALIVRDVAGRPVLAIRPAALKALQSDETFLAVYASESG